MIGKRAFILFSSSQFCPFERRARPLFRNHPWAQRNVNGGLVVNGRLAAAVAVVVVVPWLSLMLLLVVVTVVVMVVVIVAVTVIVVVIVVVVAVVVVIIVVVVVVTVVLVMVVVIVVLVVVVVIVVVLVVVMVVAIVVVVMTMIAFVTVVTVVVIVVGVRMVPIVVVPIVVVVVVVGFGPSHYKGWQIVGTDATNGQVHSFLSPFPGIDLVQEFRRRIAQIDRLHSGRKAKGDKKVGFVRGPIPPFEELGKGPGLHFRGLQTGNQESHFGLAQPGPVQKVFWVSGSNIDLQVVGVATKESSVLEQSRAIPWRRGVLQTVHGPTHFVLDAAQLGNPNIVGTVHAGKNRRNNGHEVQSVSRIGLWIPCGHGHDVGGRVGTDGSQGDGFWPLPLRVGLEKYLEQLGWIRLGIVNGHPTHENGPIDSSQKTQHVGLDAVYIGPRLDGPQRHAKGFYAGYQRQHLLGYPRSVDGSECFGVQAHQVGIVDGVFHSRFSRGGGGFLLFR